MVLHKPKIAALWDSGVHWPIQKRKCFSTQIFSKQAFAKSTLGKVAISAVLAMVNASTAIVIIARLLMAARSFALLRSHRSNGSSAFVLSMCFRQMIVVQHAPDIGLPRTSTKMRGIGTMQRLVLNHQPLCRGLKDTPLYRSPHTSSRKHGHFQLVFPVGPFLWIFQRMEMECHKQILMHFCHPTHNQMVL